MSTPIANKIVGDDIRHSSPGLTMLTILYVCRYESGRGSYIGVGGGVYAMLREYCGVWIYTTVWGYVVTNRDCIN